VFARTTILSSSNAGSVVTFSAGTKDVFLTLAATKTTQADGSGNVGIGTSSPGTKLDAYTSGTTSTVLRTRNDTTTVYLDANNGYSYLNTFSNHPMLFGTNNTERARVSADGGFMVGTTTDPGAGYISDKIGNVRSVPQNAQTTGYTLVALDAGKHISITTGGVTVPASVFSIGDTVTIYNNSGSNQTITQGSSVTLRQVGTASTGNRTLAQYGLCTVLCVASNTFVITGGGLT
jgi:hypothetical protein